MFQGLPIQYHHSATQHSIGFCWQKQLGVELHCLALQHAHNSGLLLTAVIQLKRPKPYASVSSYNI